MPADGTTFRPEVKRMPLDELRAIQERKLRAQLGYVWERPGLYREKLGAQGIELGDIRSLDDLVRLPLTTKQEFRYSQSKHPPLGSHGIVGASDTVDPGAGVVSDAAYLAEYLRDRRGRDPRVLESGGK